MGLLSQVVAGVVGGMAGGLAMKAMMTMGQQLGVVETPVPLKVERRVERRMGLDHLTGPQDEKNLAMAEHMMISAAFGAGYGALREAFDLPAIPGGPLYGLAVYAINLAGLGPALDLMPGPWHEEPTTVGRRVMMHVLYGAVTALVAEQARQLLDGDERPMRYDRSFYAPDRYDYAPAPRVGGAYGPEDYEPAYETARMPVYRGV